MIETKEKEIKGAIYSVTQMTARNALKMKTKIIKIFGPSIAGIFSSAKVSEDNPNIEYDVNGLIHSIQALCSQIDENTFWTLCVELLSGVRKNGKELTESQINMEFAGDLYSLFAVIVFVLEVNYHSFLAESGILKLAQEEMSKKVPQKISVKKLSTES